MPIERLRESFYVLALGNSYVCPFFHRLRDSRVRTFQSTRFEYLTFNMEVKDVEDFDENLQSKEPANMHKWAKI